MKIPRVSFALGLVLFSFFAAPLSHSAAALKSSTLWDSWYIVTVNDSVPYAYYNEKAEVIDGRTRIALRITKKEEGVLNEEIIGAFAKDTPALDPLFYNYRSTYKTTETVIDGTIDDEKQLVVKIRKGGNELPTVRKRLPKDAILSYMFPIWLARKLPSLKVDKGISFYALAEDRTEEAFPVTVGTVTMLKPDDIATKTATQRIKVSFADADSIWWVKKNGNAFAINTPLRKTLIQLVSQEKAKAFLK